MGDHPPKETRPSLPSEDMPRDPFRNGRIEDPMSTIMGDTLVVFRKKFFFPNDLVLVCPKRSDRARSPPPGYIVIYEMSLNAGLRFPLVSELIPIISACEVFLSQFSCRALTIVEGLIVFFRERKTTLTIEFLSRMCKFFSDSQGRITCRNRLLDLRTKDPLKNWSSRFFFVKNEWGLPEKWRKLSDVPIPLHTVDKDILRALNFSNIEDLRYDTRFINKFLREESLFGVGLSIHPARSHVMMVRKSSKEISSQSPKRLLSPSQKNESSPSKKRKNIADAIVISGTRGEPSLTTPPSDKLLKIRILEEVLNHSCIGRQHAEELRLKRQDLDFNLNTVLNNWNTEFVKVKFLQGEYRKKCLEKAKEMSALEIQLAECRTKMANLVTSVSLQRQEVDRTRDELVEARAEISYTSKDLQTYSSKISDLEVKNKDLRARLSEKDAALSQAEARAGSKAIEEFKSSTTFKSIIQEHVQKAVDHVYQVEVKALELQCMEEGFTRGLLKGTRLVYRRTGASFEDLSPS